MTDHPSVVALPTNDSQEEQPARNVIEALRRVMRDLPAIGKDLRSPQGYNYRGIESITQHAQALFARHGVVFAPHVLSKEVEHLTVNGKPWTDTTLTVSYTVYGPGGTTDKIEVGPLVGIGRDNSDKGSNKAATQAFKYALIQTLCVADAKDDVDALPAAEADPYSQTARADREGPPLGPEEQPTPAGNLRRGPQVAEGWENIIQQREAHARLRDEANKLATDGQRDFLREWMRKQGYVTPLTLDQMVDTMDQLRQLREAPAAPAPSEPLEGPVSPTGVVTAAAPVPGGTGPHSAPNGPPDGQGQQAARHALAEAARRDAIAQRVRAMRVPDVRNDLRLAELDDTGTGPEAKDRLIEHLFATGYDPEVRS